MFRPDSLPIRFLTKVCDLLFLNLALVLSCLTVVFSGAAVTTLYAQTLKMFRGEDCASVRGFLRALGDNFLASFPATLLLFVDAALLLTLRRVLYADVLLMPPAVFTALSIAALFLTALLSYLFPLLARFENSFPRHLGNAVRLAVANLPITVLLTVVNLLPLLLTALFPALLGLAAAFWLMIGFAAGAWLNSFYLHRIFSGVTAG